MKSASNLFLCVSIFSLLWNPCLGQDPDAIYGIYDDEVGAFHFSKVNLVTGSRTDYQVVSTTITDAFSSDVNVQDAEYFLSTGRIIKTYDANTGNLLASDTLPINATAFFRTIRYNPCD